MRRAGLFALLLLIGLPTVSAAAIAEVSSGSQRATTASSVGEASRALAFPGAVTQGNLLVVAGRCRNNPIPSGIDSISDSRGTTYTIKSYTFDARVIVFIAYGIAASTGSNTVTVDCSGDALYAFAVDEFSGVSSSPLDVDGGSSSGTDTAPSDAITTNVADALIIGIAATNTGLTTLTYTAGGSYTQIGENENELLEYNAVFRIATTATSYTVDWTIGATELWIAATASFVPSTGGGGGGGGGSPCIIGGRASDTHIASPCGVGAR